MMNACSVLEEYLSRYGFINIKFYLYDFTNQLEFMHKYKEGRYIIIDKEHCFYYSNGVIYDNTNSIEHIEASYSKKIRGLFVCVSNLQFKYEISKALTKLESSSEAEDFHVDKLRAMCENAIKREEI
jgi:hypothetical protein